MPLALKIVVLTLLNGMLDAVSARLIITCSLVHTLVLRIIVQMDTQRIQMIQRITIVNTPLPLKL